MNQRQGKKVRQPGHRMSPRSTPKSDLMIPSGGGVMEGVYANPEMAHVLTTLMGCVVDVQLKSGLVFEGILRAVSTNMDVALEVAHAKTKALQPPSRDSVVKTLELKFGDIVFVSAKTDSNPSMGARDIFKTDAEISRFNGPSGDRDLQPFMDFGEDYSETSLDLDEGTSTGTGWSVDEMWEVNKAKFKVQSSYDEAMTEYTTQLAKSDTDDFREREARAMKLANEIEIKDKKRHGIDDSGTEEEMFSSVVRLPVCTEPSIPEEGSESRVSSSQEKQNDSPSAATSQNSLARSQSHPQPADEEKSQKTDSIAVASSLSEGPPPSAREEEESERDTGSAETKPEDPASSSTKTPISLEEGEGEGGQEPVEKQAEEEGKREDSSKDSKDSIEGTPATAEELVDSIEGTPATEELVATADSPKSENKNKDDVIKNFKLDPNAKVFNPSSFAPPVTTVATTRASPSSMVSSSSPSLRSSPSYHSPTASRPRYKRGPNRTYPSSTSMQPLLSPSGVPHEPILITSSPTASSGYVLSAGQPAVVSSGLMRPMQQLPGGQVLFPYGGGFPGQGLIPTHQVVGSPKFVEVPTPPHQALGGQQLTLLHQHQLLAQQGQSPLLPTVSQAQAQMMAQQALLSSSPHSMLFMQGPAAAGMHIQPTLTMHQGGFMSAAGVPPNRIVTYSPHQLGK